MKELTIEQKAKAYDKAVERAKEWFNPEEPDSYTCIVESIFPELKESEDKRIRKEIVAAINIYCSEYLRGTKVRDDMLAWLEKHEWKPSDRQIKTLKIVKDYVASNNWNEYICNNLKDLLDQLKKL